MRPTVAFDIETTGLTVGSEVVVIGTSDGEHTLVQVQPTDLFQGFLGGFNDRDGVSVRTYSDEQALLEHGLQDLVTRWGLGEDDIDTPMLVGFNSELQYGQTGFDVPFLRTRCARQDIEWELAGVEHLDVMQSFADAFLTKQPDPSGLNKDPLREFGEYVGADVDSDMYKREIRAAVEAEAPAVEELEAFATEYDHDLPTRSRRSLDGLADLFLEFEPESTVDGADIPAIMQRYDRECELEGETLVEAEDVVGILQHNIDDLHATLGLLTTLDAYGSPGSPVVL